MTNQFEGLSVTLRPLAAGNSCPCGSGETLARCCAREGMPLASFSGLNPDTALTAIRHLHASARVDEAVRQCRTLLHIVPNHVPTLEYLSQCLRSGRELQAALAPLSRLVEIEPGNHDRHAALAGLHYDLQRYPEAESAARQALALNPLNPQAHNLLGMIFLDVNEPEHAEFHFRQVLLLHEPLSPICANLANVLKTMGRLDEAESFFRQAMYLDPENIDALLSWAWMEEARNNLVRAREILAGTASKFAHYPQLRVANCALWRREKHLDLALAEIEALEQEHPEFRRSAHFHYERGNVLDAAGRYDEAFASYVQANQAVRASGSREYQATSCSESAAQLKAFFTGPRAAAIRQATVIDPLPQGMPAPIFIVGFPRSGTTMVEQMLSAHPAIAAGDELPYVWRWTELASHFCGSKLPYPACLENLLEPAQQRSLMKFRSFYIANVELRHIVSGGKRRFTDKMPLNETHLGLIHLAFPEAPIVHLLRHPLDVVLSAFFNDLTHGGNCSYDLVTAARHYALIFDLVQHYLSELNPRYLAVRYEDLVSDTELNVRKLLAFVDEPWDERCLDFHENARYARTASYAQVKEKLYDRSRFRYRNYRRHVESIIPILMPAISRLGYTID